MLSFIFYCLVHRIESDEEEFGAERQRPVGGQDGAAGAQLRAVDGASVGGGAYRQQRAADADQVGAERRLAAAAADANANAAAAAASAGTNGADQRRQVVAEDVQVAAVHQQQTVGGQRQPLGRFVAQRRRRRSAAPVVALAVHQHLRTSRDQVSIKWSSSKGPC